jgi:hypothetical protein
VLVTINSFFDKVFKIRLVIIEEDLLSPIATEHDVIEATWE